MATIRSLGARELEQVLSLLERFTGDEFNYPVLERFQTLYLPFHRINQYLPLKAKFLPEIYVATSEGKVLGLVWLSRDGHTQDRWRIDQVIIDPDTYLAYDVGKQLMYFIINKFGAAGVETFLAYVDPFYTEGLALLKDCGFRHCTKLHTYHGTQLAETVNEQPVKIGGLREVRHGDGPGLQALYEDTLPPEIRISLRRTSGDLIPGWGDRLKRCFQGGFFKRWVVPCGETRNPQACFYGSVSVSTWDYRQYDVSVLVSPAWEEAGLADLLRFGGQQVAKSASNAKMTIQCYEFQKAKAEALVQLGFERAWTAEILVKDYWIPLKDQALRSRNPVLLFAKSSRTSPA